MRDDFYVSSAVGFERQESEVHTQVGIGITTKDRWEDLAVTLTELRNKGYEDVETIVIDDGSKDPLPNTLREAFPKVRFERVEHSLGLVVQRNRLAKMLSTTYYLSLDDDSFPVMGEVSEAVEWLENHPSVAALALQIVKTNEKIRRSEVLLEPFPIQFFIGCGHILRRELFLELGGYPDRLHYFSEEVVFCLNAWLHGHTIYGFPGLVIRHTRTPVARNSAKASRYYMRNQTLVGLLYFPFPFSILRALNCLLLIKEPQWNPHPFSLLVGWLEAFVCLFTWKTHRRRMSLRQFRDWKALRKPWH
jgi:GT2 family glycosyltransferase